jgi:uncharacterized membrane protein
MDATELKAIPLFSQLTAEEAAALSAMLQPRELEPNHVLFWLGEKGQEFFVIQHGFIQLTYPDPAGKEMTLAVLKAGDFLGEIALLDGGVRTATARSVGKATLLSLGREQFHQFIRQHPSSAIHMMTVLGKRQRDSVERLRGIRNANEVVAEQETTWQRAAAAFAAIAASQWFILGHAIVFGAWIIMNLALGAHAPDPFPFPFLCSWATVEAIFLSMFILVSQTVQSRKDRIRTDVEYQIALKTQMEIIQLRQMIEKLPADIMALEEK